MTISNANSVEEFSRIQVQLQSYSDYIHFNDSAVSWAAILAGATAAAALSLILLLLGAGLGLSSVSPWAYKGVSASTFGISTIVWVTVTQILAAGMGGFLAGRLRTKWAGVHTDEVYFRDTAHGFLAWAVASLATAALLATAIGSIVSGGVHATARLAEGAASTTMASSQVSSENQITKSDNAGGLESGAMRYFVDSLFRTDPNLSPATPTPGNMRVTDTAEKIPPIAEVTSIFINSMNMKTLPASDLTYISQLVSKHTGLRQQDAEKRVNDIFTNMATKKQHAKILVKEAADKARKASIYATLWLFISLLMGAFSASLAATWGGRCRDA
jgi:hypothetical protein